MSSPRRIKATWSGSPPCFASIRFLTGSEAVTRIPARQCSTKAAIWPVICACPVIVRTALASGVSFADANLVVFGANDLSDDADVTARPEPKRSKTAAFVSDFRDLTIGDYVVHVEHGIAQYQGLKEIVQDGLSVEFMILEFAEQARLYVPLTRLDLIQKYRSTDAGPAPVLNRLGSQQWAKTKARVRKAMQDMTAELVKLYAERTTAQGTAFSKDNEFQKEFEDSFDYLETDDQLSAIRAIKYDMESTTPMDRLLCGDVGYGKTEVAMRAAFKAVQDGKQVAVLTPTTILSFQHFETFKKRFSQLPIIIEMISRFRTAKEQLAIVEKVETGKIDILIGTHRLLSKDIKFQDLGLLVVDEEQRFGVKHKERLKQMRKEIDVLAMSATPIPRTLHMSLVGLRDMSVIETPPKDRMAIQTVVAKFDEKIVRSAVEVELERGGQVYFVHNRVESIYEIASRIQELVPSARVVVGHGQMGETELERVMLAFMRHEYDVLVATTIIENGLDIPLANTMLINRADRHGLSELYQLRGRVGRSNRRAYAYLLIPPEQELTEIARRRLAALKEFSDLGAGFKIAALDLELRGAGNMLGGEQSGHIEAVGFELYTSMLEAAVKEMKGESSEERPVTQLNLGIALRIDESYVPEENQRLRLYKKIAGANSEAAVAEVRAEMEDRYGTPPDATVYLLEASLVRLECERICIAQVDRKRGELQIRFMENAAVDPQHLMRLVAKNAKRGAQFTPQGLLKYPLSATRSDEILLEIHEVLAKLAPVPVQCIKSWPHRSRGNMKKLVTAIAIGVCMSSAVIAQAQKESMEAAVRESLGRVLRPGVFPLRPDQRNLSRIPPVRRQWSTGRVSRERILMHERSRSLKEEISRKIGSEAIPCRSISLAATSSSGHAETAGLCSVTFARNFLTLGENQFSPLGKERRQLLKAPAPTAPSRSWNANSHPPDDRLRSLISREKQMPGTLLAEAARDNLKNPPLVYTKIAIEQLPDIITFFEHDVPLAFADAQDPASQVRIRADERRRHRRAEQAISNG